MQSNIWVESYARNTKIYAEKPWFQILTFLNSFCLSNCLFFSFFPLILLGSTTYCRSLSMIWDQPTWVESIIMFYIKPINVKSLLFIKIEIIHNQLWNNIKVRLHMQIWKYFIIYISCTSMKTNSREQYS